MGAWPAPGQVRLMPVPLRQVSPQTWTHDGRIAGIEIPDSRMAREATALVREVAGPLLLDHSRRVYLFGSASEGRLVPSTGVRQPRRRFIESRPLVPRRRFVRRRGFIKSQPPVSHWRFVMSRPPVPPFTETDALAKVQAAEDAWNTRDPARWRWLTRPTPSGATATCSSRGEPRSNGS
ncbi:hypothetical protein GCM10010404_21810 [Nonomuraea africana]